MVAAYKVPNEVTRKSLEIFHQSSNFVGSINRSYDDKFAVEGAKIGNSIDIRLPNQFKAFDGPDMTLNFQEANEQVTTLTLNRYKSVPLQFTDKDLTLSVDDFTERFMRPAMVQLAAVVEADCFSMYSDVYNQVGVAGTIPNSLKVLNQARAKLSDSLAPAAERSMILNTDAMVEIGDSQKTLFNDTGSISKTYKTGLLVSNAGFGDIYENTMIPVHVNGSATGAITVTAPPTEGTSVINLTGTGTQVIRKGTILTIANVNSVHPETKASYGKPQQFVVTADATASGGAYTAVQVSPPFIASNTNPLQNITALPAGAAVVTLVGSANTSYAQNLAFHKNAFAFASADLILPKGTDFAGRAAFDGISMRIVRDFDVKTANFYSRADIIYGYKTIRPQAACRITA